MSNADYITALILLLGLLVVVANGLFGNDLRMAAHRWRHRARRRGEKQ